VYTIYGLPYYYSRVASTVVLGFVVWLTAVAVLRW